MATAGLPLVVTKTGDAMASSWLAIAIGFVTGVAPVTKFSRSVRPGGEPTPRTSDRYHAGPIVTGTRKVWSSVVTGRLATGPALRPGAA